MKEGEKMANMSNGSFNKYVDFVIHNTSEFDPVRRALGQGNTQPEIESFAIFNDTLITAYKKKVLLDDDIVSLVRELILRIVESGYTERLVVSYTIIIQREYPTARQLAALDSELMYYGLDKTILSIYMKKMKSNVRHLNGIFANANNYFAPIAAAVKNEIGRRETILRSQSSELPSQIDIEETNKLATTYYFLSHQEDIYRKSIYIKDLSIFNPILQMYSEDEELLTNFISWFISLLSDVVDYLFSATEANKRSNNHDYADNEIRADKTSKEKKVIGYYEFSKDYPDSYLDQHNRKLEQIVNHVFESYRFVPFDTDANNNHPEALTKLQELSKAKEVVKSSENLIDDRKSSLEAIRCLLIELGLDEKFANVYFKKMMDRIIPVPKAKPVTVEPDRQNYKDQIKRVRNAETTIASIDSKPSPVSMEDMEKYISANDVLKEEVSSFLTKQIEALIRNIDNFSCIAQLKDIYNKYKDLFVYYYNNLETNDEDILFFELVIRDIDNIPDSLELYSNRELMDMHSCLIPDLKKYLLQALYNIKPSDIYVLFKSLQKQL